jgi:hypothetical protein
MMQKYESGGGNEDGAGQKNHPGLVHGVMVAK